jgi:hypothetical protein
VGQALNVFPILLNENDNQQGDIVAQRKDLETKFTERARVIEPLANLDILCQLLGIPASVRSDSARSQPASQTEAEHTSPSRKKKQIEPDAEPKEGNASSEPSLFSSEPYTETTAWMAQNYVNFIHFARLDRQLNGGKPIPREVLAGGWLR